MTFDSLASVKMADLLSKKQSILLFCFLLFCAMETVTPLVLIFCGAGVLPEDDAVWCWNLSFPFLKRLLHRWKRFQFFFLFCRALYNLFGFFNGHIQIIHWKHTESTWLPPRLPSLLGSVVYPSNSYCYDIYLYPTFSSEWDSRQFAQIKTTQVKYKKINTYKR